MEYAVSTFYTFTPLKKRKLKKIQQELVKLAEEAEVLGLLLVATEGANGMFSGTQQSVIRFQEALENMFGPIHFKNHASDNIPFQKIKVKIKPEIVALGDTSIVPDKPNNNHLTPEEWHEMCQQEDVIVLDTRNTYETKIGKFKNAIDPNIRTFREFKKFLEETPLPKDKKVLMYCTEGVRCEKASIAMQRAGYKNVYQLQHGIINYMQQFPDNQFEGECFVFDRRVAVGKDLKPSKQYKICPHCGDPGDRPATCARCNADCVVCADCLSASQEQTCSKNCRYLYTAKNKKTTTSAH